MRTSLLSMTMLEWSILSTLAMLVEAYFGPPTSTASAIFDWSLFGLNFWLMLITWWTVTKVSRLNDLARAAAKELGESPAGLLDPELAYPRVWLVAPFALLVALTAHMPPAVGSVICLAIGFTSGCVLLGPNGTRGLWEDANAIDKRWMDLQARLYEREAAKLAEESGARRWPCGAVSS